MKLVVIGTDHVVVLHKDGTAIAVGRNMQGECNVSEWGENIVSVAASCDHSIGTDDNKNVFTRCYNGEGQYIENQEAGLS